MEKFERIDIVLHLHHRTVERQGVIHNLLQRLGIHILTKEGISHRIGDLLEGLGLDGVEEGLRQLLDLLRHVEPTVFCQSFHHRLM